MAGRSGEFQERPAPVFLSRRLCRQHRVQLPTQEFECSFRYFALVRHCREREHVCAVRAFAIDRVKQLHVLEKDLLAREASERAYRTP